LNAINELLRPLRPPRETDDAKERILSSPLFTSHDERTFPNVERVDAERVVDQVSSISAVVGASAKDRERVLGEVRALVGDGVVDFRMITNVIAADRA
jgi:hypothetical protein